MPPALAAELSCWAKVEEQGGGQGGGPGGPGPLGGSAAGAVARSVHERGFVGARPAAPPTSATPATNAASPQPYTEFVLGSQKHLHVYRLQQWQLEAQRRLPEVFRSAAAHNHLYLPHLTK